MFVAIALRALAVTPETNSLPLVEALAQEDLPHDLVLPVANLLVAKNSSRLSVLVSPLVERMTPLERKCFSLSTSDSATGCHIPPPIAAIEAAEARAARREVWKRRLRVGALALPIPVIALAAIVARRRRTRAQ